MSKRFTDSDKWKKDWFINLSKEGKLLWIYITDCCDHAGICDFSEKIFSACLDFKVSKEKLNECLNSKIEWIEECKFLIPSFIDFQYGDLNEKNRVHKSVIDRLNKIKEAPYKPLISPLQGVKDKDKDKDKEICSSSSDDWKTNFSIYLDDLNRGVDEILSDIEWIEMREKYHPNLNITLSLEKAYNDFWSTEAGWKNKKASKTKKIDWKATFINALTMKANQVWKQK